MIELILVLALSGLMHAARSFATDMSSATELAFGYLLLVAFFLGRLGNRVGLPKLTGYLLAGVIAGPFVLALVDKSMTGSLRVVSAAATSVLGLTAGGELDLREVRPLAATLRSLTLYALVVSMIVLALVLLALRPLLPMFDGLDFGASLAASAVVAVALTAQSPAVVMALLNETGAEGPLSRFILATVVVGDLVVVIIYSLVAAVAGAVTGGEVDMAETGFAIAWELVGSMVFGIAIGIVIGRFIQSVERGASLFALMVCVIVAEIGSRVHLDPLVVMLAAGVWLRNFSRADAGVLLHNFESAALPVFLVFFSLAGTNLDLEQLVKILLPVAIIAAVRAALLNVGTRVACRRTSANPVVARYGWVGLVPQAGLSLALVVVIQKTFPTFGARAGVLLLSVVGINQLIAPVILRACILRSGEAGKRAMKTFGH